MRKNLLVAVLAAALTSSVGSAATFTIINTDGAGEGFNDPTAAAPVGGNTAVTVGGQRLAAFDFAASLWGSLLDSDVDIRIQAAFNPLTCAPTSGVLGSAGALTISFDFTNADFTSTWYQGALANKLLGADDDGGTSNEIIATFNSNVGTAGCLTTSSWYYGFDANEPVGGIDLVSVLLHEFGHGLGFANFVNEGTGANFNGPPQLTDVYSHFTRDNTLSQVWSDINPTAGSEAAIQASALRCGQIAWSGPNVTAAVAGGALQLGTPLLTVSAPVVIAGSYQVGAAAWGPAITSTTGTVVQALDPADGAGPTTFDACSPLTNAAAILGNIAIVDRGTCGFALKAENVQNAGAIAMIVADNAAGCPPAGLGGVPAVTITIPAARITQPDGVLIKAQLGAGVTATLGVDLTRRAGADTSNRALLAALNPVAPGSSISHFDSSHFPNSLMEPSINSDLNPPVNDVDLTFELFQDIGWFKLDGSLTQADSADPVLAGAAYSYTIDATNGGSGTDRPVTVTSQLPAGSTFVSATGTAWSCSEAALLVTCSRPAVAGPNLPTGAAPQITVSLNAPALPGVYGNLATINVPSPLIDPNNVNNSENESTTVISPATISGPTKVVSGTFAQGSNVTYTIILTNTSASAQADNPGDEFVDTLPAGLLLVSASATSGTAAVAGNTATWNGSIPGNGSVTITITATVTAGVGATVSNQGTVNFDADGNGTNESTVLTDDPGTGAATDPTGFTVGSVIEVPTLGDFGLLGLGLGIAGAAAAALRRRRKA